MRRVGGLYPRIGQYDNLVRAFQRAARAKRDRHAVRRFAEDLDQNLSSLRRELEQERITWHGYRMFMVRDPKPRRIAAPAFRDRVLHHAVMQVVEPELERVAIFDSYACRRGKGLHRAVVRAQSFCRRHRWFLQLDVRKFFDSIDHDALRRLLARRLKDVPLLRLFDALFDSYSTAPGKGLPIGSLTSQHLANFYLARLDHCAKEELRAPGYVRYMDDFVLFDDMRERLVEARMRIADLLREELCLNLRDAGALDRTSAGIGFLGARILPTHVLLLGKTKRRLRRKLRGLVTAHEDGAVCDSAFAMRATALLARTHHVCGRGLRKSWIEEFAGVEV